MRLFASLLAILTTLGCGATVTPLDLRDPRLPAEARRWVADAQDAVVVATARYSDAEGTLRDVERWRSSLRASAMSDPAAAGALNDMAARRVEIGRMQLDLAFAEVELAQARLIQAHAETAMRHDLEVYDLAPIEAHTQESQKTVAATRRAIEDQRRQLQQAADDWWAAYRQFVVNGGDVGAFWAIE